MFFDLTEILISEFTLDLFITSKIPYESSYVRKNNPSNFSKKKPVANRIPLKFNLKTNPQRA